MAILVANALSKRFGRLEALAGLDLEVSRGEIYGLVGPDGAGKTTAIRLMTGIMVPSSGTVLVGGLAPIGNDTRVRDILGYMPQQYSLYGDLTVEENLTFYASMFSLSRTAYEERKTRLLTLTRLARFVNRRADALSGGMYKKLALACALLHHPELIVLDEPTNGVDPVSRREFWDLLREFSGQGMAIILATPYMDEAARCHRVGLMHEGRLLLEGEPQALLAAFPYRSFRVCGGDRNAVAKLLGGHSRVLALSSAGASPRVVLKQQATEDLRRELGSLGAELVATAPDFEDLFVSRLSQTQARGAA
jgi:ABC-2 type transport system ATP-binding protein